MRNVFDQYSQPENRLTHALYCTLVREPSLIRRFLEWLRIGDAPTLGNLQVVQQQVPGAPQEEPSEDGEGLPDLCIYTDDGWAVVAEMKVQSTVKAGQLRRHEATAKRYGFESPVLVAIGVDPTPTLPEGVVYKQWRELYAWLCQQPSKSEWVRLLVEYMEIFEAKVTDQGYQVRGTITMFNGLPFGSDQAYTYPQGKRLVRLLGDELKKRSDLRKELGIDGESEGRGAITDDAFGVWDFIPLRDAGEKGVTEFPHLTLGVWREKATAAVTVPNGYAAKFKSRLKSEGLEGFLETVWDVEKALRPIIKRSKGRPIAYALQRHYYARTYPTVDGDIRTDVRTCVQKSGSKVKHQPQWVEAIYEVLVNKRSNIQFGLQMEFEYTLCPIVHSPAITDAIADAWKAMKPMLDFVVGEPD